MYFVNRCNLESSKISLHFKKIKLNWANPISRYISFQFYSHSYHVQLKAINSLESQKETEPIYSLFCTFCVKLIILCRELSLTVGLSRVAPLCCLIVKTLSSPRTQTIGSKLYIQTFNRPHFHPGPVFYVPRTISDQHTEKLLQDIWKKDEIERKPLPHLFTAVQRFLQLHSPCVRWGGWNENYREKAFIHFNCWLHK